MTHWTEHLTDDELAELERKRDEINIRRVWINNLMNRAKSRRWRSKDAATPRYQ